jgi:hypothetical protein
MSTFTGMESIPLACEQEIRFTRQVEAGGSASELAPGMLEQVLSWVPQGSPKIELH